jgi:serine/threonine-protein kinase RsbT
VESTATTADLRAGVGETRLAIVSESDIVAARLHGRSLVLQLGFSSPDATIVATAISELARNILLYARQGEIVLCLMEQDGRSGVRVIARDEGPGIPDTEQAALRHPSEPGARRLGLRGMKHLVDDFELVSALGKGTTVAVTKWKTAD